MEDEAPVARPPGWHPISFGPAATAENLLTENLLA